MKYTVIDVNIKIKGQYDPENIKEWFVLWFWNSPLVYETLEPITVRLSDGQEITVPANFENDGSSAPRILWSFFPPIGAFIKAAIVHDYIYKRDIGRKEMGEKKNKRWADFEMYYLSEIYNPEQPLDNWTRYKAVQLFGWKIYLRTKK